MPTRDLRGYCNITQDVSGVKYTVPYPQRAGTYQEISAFNKAGTFKNGLLRLNPVIIRRLNIVPDMLTRIPDKTYWGTTTYISGSPAACLCPNSIYTAPGYLLGYDSWNKQEADFALQKAYNKACEPDFDVGIILGELRETIHGLAQPLSALRKRLNLYTKWYGRKPGHRYRFKRAPNTADDFDALSGSWLEWRYGINPLLITIESAKKVVEHGLSKLDGKMLRSTGRYVKPRVRKTVLNTGGFGVGDCVYSLDGFDLIDTTTTAKLYYRLTRPVTIIEQLGLDVTNIPSVLWEVVPLSFVVDWLFSVGNWIGALRFDFGRASLASCVTRKVTYTRTLNAYIEHYGAARTRIDFPCVITYEGIQREINLTPPTLPLVNPAALSTQRTVDAISLMWQRLPRFWRKA